MEEEAAAAAAAAMPQSSPKQPGTPVSLNTSSAQHDAPPPPSSLTSTAAHTTTPSEEHKVDKPSQGAPKEETTATPRTDGGREEGGTHLEDSDLILECVADMDACFKAFDKDE